MSIYVMQDSWQSNNELNEELCTPPRKKARLTAAEEDGDVSPNTDEGYVSRVSFEETPQDPGKKSHWIQFFYGWFAAWESKSTVF